MHIDIIKLSDSFHLVQKAEDQYILLKKIKIKKRAFHSQVVIVLIYILFTEYDMENEYVQNTREMIPCGRVPKF